MVRFILASLFTASTILSWSQVTTKVDITSKIGEGGYQYDIGMVDEDSLIDVVIGANYSTSITEQVEKIAWHKMDISGHVVERHVIDTLTCNELLVLDKDNDGDDDVVIISQIEFSADIVVYENLGCGEFTSPTIIDSIWIFKTLTSGDFNNDGFTDLLAILNQDVVILWNDGSGDYLSSDIVIPGGFSNERIFCGDIDGDGFDDMSYVRNGDVFYHLNNNTGGFSSPVIIDISPYFIEELKISDFDFDGDLDFVVYHNANTHQEFFLLENQNQSFITVPLANTTNFYEFSVGDYNQDMSMDIITAFDSVKAYINNGSLMFQDEPVSLNASIPDEIILHDFTQDGYPDVLHEKTGVYIAENDPVNLGASLGPINWINDLGSVTAVGDVNGDGINDVLFSSSSTNQTFIALQDTAGYFHVPENIPTSSPIYESDVAEIADMNGDGSNDLILSDGLKFVWMNYNGTFWTENTILTGISAVEEMDIMDYDNDSDLDILAATNIGVVLLSNDGAGNFSLVSNLNGVPLGFVSDIEFADLNSDSYVDGVISFNSLTDNILGYFPGNSMFDMGPIINIDSVSLIRAFDIADIDADGDLDIVAAANDLLGYYNQGSGNFNHDTIAVTSTINYDVLCEDTDDDNDLDIYVAGFDHLDHYNQVSVSNFTHQTIAWNEQIRGLELADIHNTSDNELMTVSAKNLLYFTDSIGVPCNSVVNDTSTNSTTEITLDTEKIDFLIYPNPGTSHVSITSKEVILAVRVTDLTGKEILSTKSNELRVENWKEGVYLITVSFDGGVYMTKQFIRN